jgi:hypothetical protein
MPTKYRVTSWRHIPTMITASGDGREVKAEMPKRFMSAVDAYAMAVGLTGPDDYSAQWKKGPWRECEGTPEEVIKAVLAELEAQFKVIEIPKRNS